MDLKSFIKVKSRHNGFKGAGIYCEVVTQVTILLVNSHHAHKSASSCILQQQLKWPFSKYRTHTQHYLHYTEKFMAFPGKKVQIFFQFSILQTSQLFRSLLGILRLFEAIQGRLGPFRAIQGHLGPFRAIQGNVGNIRVSLTHFGTSNSK